MWILMASLIIGPLTSAAASLNTQAKRSCWFALGNHCFTDRLDQAMNMKDYLSSGASPGKRSSGLPLDVRVRTEEQIQSFNEQMNAVNTLRTLLDRLTEQARRHVKRTCQFGLGNHCLTEALDRAVSQYHYLTSPGSPGRRKRQAETGTDDESVEEWEEDIADQKRKRR